MRSRDIKYGWRQSGTIPHLGGKRKITDFIFPSLPELELGNNNKEGSGGGGVGGESIYQVFFSGDNTKQDQNVTYRCAI